MSILNFFAGKKDTHSDEEKTGSYPVHPHNAENGDQASSGVHPEHIVSITEETERVTIVMEEEPSFDTKDDSENIRDDTSGPKDFQEEEEPFVSEKDKMVQGKRWPPEFEFLARLIAYRVRQNFQGGSSDTKPIPPPFAFWQLKLTDFIEFNKNRLHPDHSSFTEDEASLLLLAIAPHVHPDLLDIAIQTSIEHAGEFPQLGGIRPDGKNFRGFLPTGETALFLLGDDNYNKRLEIRKLFDADHFFSRKKILWLEDLSPGEPSMSGKIIMSQDYIDTFILGKPSAPHFSSNFPAKRIEEKRTREQSLVINAELTKQVNELRSWVTNNNFLFENFGMDDRLKKGYRALFYGPPGTGKTLTAGILGNELGKEVYKIDISMVVSKYIDETEKNLELLFAGAEDKGWILFFDEADALFGKRTDVRDAHDKYANQEVSYLLQRIEDYNGLIILATNKKNNIDEAFIRRFNAVLKFPFPDANERKRIWEKSLPARVKFAKEILLPDGKKETVIEPKKEDVLSMIRKYELSGGNIINIVHYASLKAAERGRCDIEKKQTDNSDEIVNDSENKRGIDFLTIYMADLLSGIRKELTKEGRPFVEIPEKKLTGKRQSEPQH